MGNIGDKSLMVLNRDVKTIKFEIINLSVAILQMSCLGKLYLDEKYHETWPSFIKDGKEVIRENETESFNNEKWLN